MKSINKKLFFILFSFFFCNSIREEQDITFSIPAVQTIEFESVYDIPKVYSTDIEKGFILTKPYCKLSISSNVPWILEVYAKNKKIYYNNDLNINVNKIMIRAEKNEFQPLGENPITLHESSITGDNQLLQIDLKRMLDWNSSPPGEWYIEPIFKIKSKND